MEDIISISNGDIVIIKAFDDVPEHRFLITEIWVNTEPGAVTYEIGGVALDGPLAGQYGEPALDQIKEITADKLGSIE
jgi:hypothetical protein